MASEHPVSLSVPTTGAFAAAARGVRWLTDACLTVAAVLFCLALAGLTADIVMRYGASSSIRGMQELVNLAFVWIYMLGIAALYALHGDAALTFVHRALPARGQVALSVLVSLVITVAMAIICRESWLLLKAQAGVHSAELGIPEPVRIAPMVLASGLIVCSGVIDIWGYLIGASTGATPPTVASEG